MHTLDKIFLKIFLHPFIHLKSIEILNAHLCFLNNPWYPCLIADLKGLFFS